MLSPLLSSLAMLWQWIETGDGAVLKFSGELAGLGELGFLGRTRPEVPVLRGRALVRLGQVHGNHVVAVTEPASIPSCDGVRTAVSDVLLTVRTADCVPVVLADAHGIALLHAGWRGLVGGILEAGLSGFAEAASIHAVLGPAIRVCCYEVGPDVAAQFPPESLQPEFGARPHLDLVHEARRRLTAGGVPARAILEAPVCTRCHQHLLASARGSRGGPERIIAFASYRRPAGLHSP